MNSKSKDIIFLLGAGASAEANIPTSSEMIDRIESLLISDTKWKQYDKLYNHVKSAIHYSAGLRGYFNKSFNYNIEVLVNTLYELERNEEHPLYPFIAVWNSRFVALAKNDFSEVKQFRLLILKVLKSWMCLEDATSADYYNGLVILQKSLNFPLPVFSLNYDLCVEHLVSPNFRVETGFAGFGKKYFWDWERFEEDSPNPLPEIFLYKIHGSINWKRDESTKQLFSVEQIETVEPDRMEVIFGRDFKLEAADPFLFYAYEFRRSALYAKLIVVIGYGFGDTHINKMLTQGLRDDKNRRLLVVSNCSDIDVSKKFDDTTKQLELSGKERDQVIIHKGTAKQFMEDPNLANILLSSVSKNADSPF